MSLVRVPTNVPSGESSLPRLDDRTNNVPSRGQLYPLADYE